MEFATLADLRGYLGLGEGDPDPEDAVKALDAANEMIRFWSRGGRYRWDGTGVVPDALMAPLRKATCIQAAYLIETGDVSGYAAAWASMSLGNLSLTGNRGSQGESEGVLQTMASPIAVVVLRNAGLITSRVGSAW